MIQMKKLIFPSVLGLLVTGSVLSGQQTPAERGMNSITTDVLKAQLTFLASDWTGGRETGEKGAAMASDYLASMLQLYGIKPAGDYPQPRGYQNIQKGNDKTYFQNFTLLKTTPGDEQILKLKSVEGEGATTSSFAYGIDFMIWPYEADIEIDAPIVFAGYGFMNERLKYNDFARLDVKGKFVLRLSGSPGFAREALTPAELSASDSDTEMILKSKGALGIIEFNPNSLIIRNRPQRDPFNLSPSESNPRSAKPYADYSIPGKTIPERFPRVIITVKIANEILSGSGFDLDAYIKRAETNSANPVPPVKGKSIYLKSAVKKETVQARNVIGVIEGENPDQVIVIGAHYDHLGEGNGYIWNGADDNGSGTVGVLTLAKAIMESGVKPARTIIFALWAAEEQGLLGSRYYVDNLTYPVKNLRLNVNFDMISRYISDDDTKKVIMTYTESCPEFRTITEENLKKYNIDLNIDYQPSKDPPGGSDHRSFVSAGVPVLRFKPGHREQYHTPADEVSTVNWDIMEKIVKISFADIYDLATIEW
jgi:hypothetical protein